MFRLTCFLDDKHVTGVLRALDGIAKDVQVVPVADANLRKGKLVDQQGNNIERFAAEWKRRKLGTIGPAQARELARAIGLSPSSYSHVLHNAVKAGLIRRLGVVKGTNKGQYGLKENGK